MNTMTEIKPAIARSISYSECVVVEVQDVNSALETLDNDENVTELDWDDERGCGKGVHVWGKRLGENFRLLLSPARDQNGI